MSTNKRYYWLKLPENFFAQKEIRKLRRVAGGDTYTIIYLKMLLKAMQDDGKLYYEGIEEDFETELSYDIDEKVENVRMTVGFLKGHGILTEAPAGEYELLTMQEMVGSETDSAKRMRRARQTKLIEESKNLDLI